MHTFGIGNGASQYLITECAKQGKGNSCFIYNQSDIEEKVVQSLTKMRLSYAVVKDLKLFDSKGNKIDVGLSE